MSTENDVTRSLRSWLREERHEDADRVLDVVFDQVPATPQRRAGWLARRFPIMSNNGLRYSIAAAAILILALLLLPRLTNLGRPDTTATPSASASRTSDVTAGSVVIGRGYVTTVEVTAKVPDGWSLTYNFARKDGIGFSAWTTDGVYADPCHWRDSLVKVERLQQEPLDEKDQIAALLAAQSGRNASGPDQVILGDWGAARVTGSVPPDLDLTSCDDGRYMTWTDVSDPGGGNWNYVPGQIDVAYIVWIDRAPPTIVDVWHQPDTSEESLDELDAVLRSIGFDYQ